MPVRDSSIDAALATELLEHVPHPAPLLAEVLRVLRPGGRLFLTVPYLWPLHDVPDDQFRYTPFALERVLRDAGFGDVELRATGGWDASLAQLLGLWARRRPMSRRLRTPVTWLATPLVRALARVDKAPSRFTESTMLTGLSGWASKPAT
jgi:SAM-dependent methyltransferase